MVLLIPVIFIICLNIRQIFIKSSKNNYNQRVNESIQISMYLLIRCWRLDQFACFQIMLSFGAKNENLILDHRVYHNNQENQLWKRNWKFSFLRNFKRPFFDSISFFIIKLIRFVRISPLISLRKRIILNIPKIRDGLLFPFPAFNEQSCPNGH